MISDIFQATSNDSSSSFDEKLKKRHYVFAKEDDELSSQEEISIDKESRKVGKENEKSKETNKITPLDETPVKDSAKLTPRRLSGDFFEFNKFIKEFSFQLNEN